MFSFNLGCELLWEGFKLGKIKVKDKVPKLS
jgi:hypothetical protein